MFSDWKTNKRTILVGKKHTIGKVVQSLIDKSLDGQIKGLQYKVIFPIENHVIERSKCMIQT